MIKNFSKFIAMKRLAILLAILLVFPTGIGFAEIGDNSNKVSFVVKDSQGNDITTQTSITIVRIATESALLFNGQKTQFTGNLLSVEDFQVSTGSTIGITSPSSFEISLKDLSTINLSDGTYLARINGISGTYREMKFNVPNGNTDQTIKFLPETTDKLTIKLSYATNDTSSFPANGTAKLFQSTYNASGNTSNYKDLTLQILIPEKYVFSVKGSSTDGIKSEVKKINVAGVEYWAINYPYNSTSNPTNSNLLVTGSDKGFSNELTLKKGLVPEGTVIPIIAQFLNDQGDSIASSDALKYIAKTSPPGMSKVMVEPSKNQSITGDGYHIYAGKPNLSDTEYMGNSDLQTIEFRSSLSLPADRAYTKVILEDTLPEISGKETAVYPSYSDSKNSGWTLKNGTSNVLIKTIQLTAEEINAIKDAANPLLNGDLAAKINSALASKISAEGKLYLTFQGAKFLKSQENKMQGTLSPYSAFGESVEQDRIVSDPIKFFFDESIGDGYFSKNYVSTKTGGRNVSEKYSANSDLSNGLDWIITASNNPAPSGDTLTDIIITDDTLDSRLYYTKVSLETGSKGMNNVFTVKGYVGTEEKFTQESSSNFVEIPDTIGKTLTKITVDFNSGSAFDLSDNEFLKIKVHTNFKDPETVKYTGNLATDRLSNTARIDHKIKIDGTEKPLGFNVFSSNYYTITQFLPKLAIKKEKLSDVTTNYMPGKDIAFLLSIPSNCDINDNYLFNSFTYVDFIPDGLDFNEIDTKDLPSNAGYTITIEDNYRNSGRKAVLAKIENIKFIDLKAKPVTLQFKTNTKASEGINTNYLYATYEKGPLEKILQLADGAGKPDKFDVNGNYNVTEQVPYSEANFTYQPDVDYYGMKYIKVNFDYGQIGQETYMDKPFSYKLSVFNGTNSPNDKLQIYDILPYVGDTAIVPNNSGDYLPRGTEFSNILTGPVVAPSDYTVYYNRSVPSSKNALTAMDDFGWETPSATYDYSKVKAIKIVLNNGKVLPARSGADFILNMKTPYVIENNLKNKIAYNSFAYTINGKEFLEPKKVYNKIIPVIPPVTKKTISDTTAEKNWTTYDAPEGTSFYFNIGLTNQNPALTTAIPNDFSQFNNLEIIDILDERFVIDSSGTILNANGLDTGILPSINGQTVRVLIDNETNFNKIKGKNLTLQIKVKVRDFTTYGVAIPNEVKVIYNGVSQITTPANVTPRASGASGTIKTQYVEVNDKGIVINNPLADEIVSNGGNGKNYNTINKEFTDYVYVKTLLDTIDQNKSNNQTLSVNFETDKTKIVQYQFIKKPVISKLIKDVNGDTERNKIYDKENPDNNNFTFNNKFTLPTGASLYKSMKLEDTVDNRIDILSTAIKANGTDISDKISLTKADNTVTVIFPSTFDYFNYVGQEFNLIINGRIKSSVITESNPVISVPNTSKLITTTTYDSNEKTLTSNQVSVNTYKEGTIITRYQLVDDNMIPLGSDLKEKVLATQNIGNSYNTALFNNPDFIFVQVMNNKTVLPKGNESLSLTFKEELQEIIYQFKKKPVTSLSKDINGQNAPLIIGRGKEFTYHNKFNVPEGASLYQNIELSDTLDSSLEVVEYKLLLGEKDITKNLPTGVTLSIDTANRLIQVVFDEKFAFKDYINQTVDLQITAKLTASSKANTPNKSTLKWTLGGKSGYTDSNIVYVSPYISSGGGGGDTPPPVVVPPSVTPPPVVPPTIPPAQKPPVVPPVVVPPANIPPIYVPPTVVPPIAPDITETTKIDTPINGTIDIPDGSVPLVSIPPAHGTVTIDNDGKWKYTPEPGFKGKDRFVIKVTHPDGSVEDVLVDIAVEDVPLGMINTPSDKKPGLPTTSGIPSEYFYMAGALAILIAILLKKRKK